MFDYTGQKCPYCEIEFENGSDIAVCPDCGTPHHRSCYSEHKACANEQKHADGFDWQSANAPTKPSVRQCPSCGKDVMEDGSFCNYCGANFSGRVTPNVNSGKETNPNNDGAFPPPPDFNYYSGDSYADSKKPTEFSGVPVADWLKYIGRSAAYYLTFFHVQDKYGRKSSFTLSAMLFPWLYFLYRKVWGFAAIAGVVSIILGAPNIIVILSEYGILSNFDLDFWNTINIYTTWMYYITNFMWGTFAVYLYRTSAAKKLKRLKLESATEQEYQSRLERVSGPSLTAAVVPFFLIFAIANVLSLLNLL